MFCDDLNSEGALFIFVESMRKKTHLDDVGQQNGLTSAESHSFVRLKQP